MGFDRKISIINAQTERDAFGGISGTPSVLASVWASVKWVSGRASHDAGKDTSISEVEFTIRYLATVNTTKRVLYNGLYYTIDAVEEIGRLHLLRLKCRRVQ